MAKSIKLQIAPGEFLDGRYECSEGVNWEMLSLAHIREIKPEGANKPAVYYTNLDLLLPAFNAGMLMIEEHLRFGREIRHMEMVLKGIK